jgi:hypothetical protein
MKSKIFVLVVMVLSLNMFWALAQGPFNPREDGYPDGTAPVGMGTPDEGPEFLYGGQTSTGVIIWINYCSDTRSGGC